MTMIILIYKLRTLSFPLISITVEIVGTELKTQRKSCEEHENHELVLAEDDVVNFNKVQAILDKRRSQ